MTTDLLALISKDDCSCLDFDDVTLLDKAQRQAVVENMDQILCYCLGAIGYQHIVRPKDMAFRRDLWDWGYSRMSKAIPNYKILDCALEVGAGVMEYFYPNAGHQARMCMASANTAGILVDDLVANPDGLEQFQAFSQRYLRGLPQPEGLCAALAEGIKDCDEFYGSRYPRAGTTAVMSLLSAIDGTCEEARLARQLPSQFACNRSRGHRATEWSVEKLAWQIRNMCGATNFCLVSLFKPTHDGEVPSEFWISGVPDLTQFFLLANDLFSFSKETLELENFNYLSLLTRARRQAGRTSLFDANNGLWTFRDTIYEACEQLISCTVALDKLFITFAESLSENFKATQAQTEVDGRTEEAEKTLKTDRENLESARLAAKYWGDFRQGLIAWHINEARYRLDSLRATFGGTADDHTADSGQVAAAVDAAAQEQILI